jgi:hypothetical protein
MAYTKPDYQPALQRGNEYDGLHFAAFRKPDYQPALQRGNEYDGLHFAAFRMSGASWSGGEAWNTGLSGLRYAAIGANRRTAAAPTVQRITVNMVLYISTSDLGVVYADGNLSSGGDILLWYTGGTASAASSTATTTATTFTDVTREWKTIDSRLNRYVFPIEGIDVGENIDTGWDNNRIAAFAYDKRGDSSGTGLVCVNPVSSTILGQTSLAPTGTVNLNDPGRFIYWAY